MATADEYAAWIVKNADKRGTPEFETVAQAYKLARAGMPKSAPVGGPDDPLSAENIDPTKSMSFGAKLEAGIGQGLTSLVRGAGQLVRKMGPVYAYSADALGLPGDQATIDEAKRLDAPLLRTGGGMVGSVLGQVAPTVLAAPVMGSGVVAGATSGAALGGLQPVASDDSRLTNVALGGILGAAAPVVGRALTAGYGAVRGAVEPFTETGRQAIAGRTMQRFGITPQDLIGLSSAPSSTGARNMLAEQITRPEGAAAAARLQDAVRTLDPEIAARMAAREVENNAARVGSLQGLAGNDATRSAAEAARTAATQDLYQQATKAAYTVDDKLAALLKRPAVQQAMARAKTLAENQGRSISFEVNPSNAYAGLGIPNNNSVKINGQALQDLKMAMDEMLTDPASGFAGKAGSTIKDLRGQLLAWMEDANPAFKAARTTFAEKSKPINAQDTATELLRRGTANTGDLGGNPRLMPNAFLGALRDPKGLIERGTGRRGVGNSLDAVFEPDQINLLQALTGELDKGAAVARAANGPGSGTAQRMASNNLLHQIGIPENMTDNAFIQTLMRPVQFGAKMAEPRIQQLLLEVIQNPGQAAAVMAKATPAQRIALDRMIKNPQLLQAVQQSIPATGLTAANGSR